MYILRKKNLNDMLDKWSKAFEVYTPQYEDSQVMLLPYEKSGFTTDYINFAFPVKEYFFKERERLFDWSAENGNISLDQPGNVPETKRLLFGVRACDLCRHKLHGQVLPG